MAEIALPDTTAEWLASIITTENKKIGPLAYIFCDDEQLLQINREYLQHDYYTDIITFDYTKGKVVSGDIFISLQRVFDNAKALGNSEKSELFRVLAHGILHLCGYPDKDAQQQKLMRSKEEFYLQSAPTY